MEEKSSLIRQKVIHHAYEGFEKVTYVTISDQEIKDHYGEEFFEKLQDEKEQISALLDLISTKHPG
jgi:hypothetical protein